MPKPYCADNVPSGNAGSRSAVRVLTALGERDEAVRNAELRAGGVLLAMTHDEGLSMREAVEWCGGGVTLREVTRLRHLAEQHSGGGMT
jgi:hypothetical protein